LGIDHRILIILTCTSTCGGSSSIDGPSAGIYDVDCDASVFTAKKNQRANSGRMTGEIHLDGKVNAVGGNQEKISAAKRADQRDHSL